MFLWRAGILLALTSFIVVVVVAQASSLTLDGGVSQEFHIPGESPEMTPADAAPAGGIQGMAAESPGTSTQIQAGQESATPAAVSGKTAAPDFGAAPNNAPTDTPRPERTPDPGSP